MVSEATKTGIRTALRLHEIGDKSPYQLYFAGKGKSGARGCYALCTTAATLANMMQMNATTWNPASVSA